MPGYQGKGLLLLDNPQDILEAMGVEEAAPVMYEKNEGPQTLDGGAWSGGKVLSLDEARSRRLAPHKRGDSTGADARYWSEHVAQLIDFPRDAETTELEFRASAHKNAAEMSRLNRALNWLWPLIGRMPYGWWASGIVPPYSPAWAINEPCPSVTYLGGQTVFCEGVINLLLRSVGKRVPTYGNLSYDGGTYACGIYYRDYIRPFRLSDVEPGDLIGRYYRGSFDQGHVAVVLDGDVLLQSFDGNRWLEGGYNGPGLNRLYSVGASHAATGYEFRVPRGDWINYVGDETHKAVA